MKTSDQINEIAAALSKAQAEISPAAKDNANEFFNASYADLSSVWNVCRGPLTKNSLAIVQGQEDSDLGIVRVTTRMVHASGQWIEHTVTMRPKDMSPQSVGSAITYGRRYGLASLVGVVADEDDDGNTAQHGQKFQKNSGEQGSPSKTLDSRGQEQSPMSRSSEPKPSASPDKSAQKWQPSEKQLNRLYAIAKAHGYDSKTAVEALGVRYGVTSTTSLSRVQYDDFCAYMEKFPHSHNAPPQDEPPAIQSFDDFTLK